MNAIEGFVCRWCRTFHEDQIDAANCCQPPLEAWQCAECEEVYYSEDVADECCTGQVEVEIEQEGGA